MRIDHHAYQRATRVAAAGLAVQSAIALLLLLLKNGIGRSERLQIGVRDGEQIELAQIWIIETPPFS
jgi:hypothetical protein